MLKRCLVGGLEYKSKEVPTLSEIRRWSSSTWQNTFGVNIYEINNRRFLFEFHNRFSGLDRTILMVLAEQQTQYQMVDLYRGVYINL